MNFIWAFILAILSGAAALAYETLWNRVFANIFGVSVFNSTLVIVVFFVALSLGAASIRLWSLLQKSPWLSYALLELAIALTMLPTLFAACYNLYPLFESSFFGTETSVKIVVVGAFVGIPTFFMGGTLLALIEAIRNIQFKGKVSVLYGGNTLGGVVGIISVTFYAIYSFGVSGTLQQVMALSVLLGISAFILHIFSKRDINRYTSLENVHREDKDHIEKTILYTLAGMSGLVVIGFEVVMLHACAQVGHNSSWSFGIILIQVIAILGFAALISSFGRYSRKKTLLFIVPLIAGTLCVFPLLFYKATNGLKMISISTGRLEVYLTYMLIVGLVSAGPVLFTCGLIFPWLLDQAKNYEKKGIKIIGWLLSINALCAVIGALLVQFVLLPRFGIWRSCVLLGVVPLVVWILMMTKMKRGSSTWCAWVWGAVICACFVMFLSITIPHVRLGDDATLINLKVGPSGVVCVKQLRGKNIIMTVNNNFTLSSGKYPQWNRLMSHIPLLMHENPRDIAYIGLATGMTASGAQEHDAVESITVVEMNPLVIDASLEYFGPLSNYFYKDPRVTIVQDDGVHYFGTAKERYDVIIGDLFFAWNQGAYRLYTYEHFVNIRDHLNKDGLFCQWIPLYQHDRESFELIARTFLRVFPNNVVVVTQVGKWQCVALIGIKSSDIKTILPNELISQKRLGEEPIVLQDLRNSHYSNRCILGNIARYVDKSGAINTVDIPLLEPMVIRVEPKLREKTIYIDMNKKDSVNNLEDLLSEIRRNKK